MIEKIIKAIIELNKAFDCLANSLIWNFMSIRESYNISYTDIYDKIRQRYIKNRSKIRILKQPNNKKILYSYKPVVRKNQPYHRRDY